MKTKTRLYFILYILLICSACSSNNKNNTSTETIIVYTDLIDEFKRRDLHQQPHAEWFERKYSKYNMDSVYINKLKKINTDSIRIALIMGTWCSDSRNVVPHFFKVLDTIGIDEKQISMIGVDTKKETYRTDLEQYQIQRVPTFIFYKNNNEIGRIIEYPVKTMEKDMFEILTKH